MRNQSSNQAAPQPASQTNSPSIPKTEPTPTVAQRVKSHVRKILLASPLFPRLYADLLVSEGYNPNEASILAERYQKKFGVNMSAQSNVSTCTHIKVTGVRCGSPALRGEQFCYFHQRMVRGVRTPPQSRLHPIAFLENEESIQVSLMEIVNALLRGTIDLKRGELILRALNTAVRNCRRAKFDHLPDVVREVPNYSQPEHAEPSGDGSAHVATAALDLPPDAAVSETPRPSPLPESTVRAQQAELQRQIAARVGRTPASPAPDRTQKKPPHNVKRVPTSKERKIAARAASSG